MAELATIARPYAEALFKAAGAGAPSLKAPMAALAAVAADPALRQFADNPKAQPSQVVDVVANVAGGSLDAKVANLLRAVVENGRLEALPEISAQFAALVNAQSGVADATIWSAFPIDAAQLADLTSVLEKRFGRKLNPTVEIDAALIGGIRVVVGDEVLDTSVKSRLEQMKAALVA